MTIIRTATGSDTIIPIRLGVWQILVHSRTSRPPPRLEQVLPCTICVFMVVGAEIQAILVTATICQLINTLNPDR